MILGLGISKTEKSSSASLEFIFPAELAVSFCTTTADRNEDGLNVSLEIFE